MSRLRSAWRRVEAAHDAVFTARWRMELRREARREEEELLGLLLLEAMGAQSPVSYYALEVYPWVLTKTHQLHRSRGIDRLASSACC
ncbi:MAG: hypothetical protein ACLGIV_04660 [Actinomycetes bacterium]